MLPKLDGFEVLRRMRADQIAVPTILLTAKDTNSNIVKGLDLGADDYMTKPFDIAVLLARLRALTRRSPLMFGRHLNLGRLLLEPPLTLWNVTVRLSL